MRDVTVNVILYVSKVVGMIFFFICFVFGAPIQDIRPNEIFHVSFLVVFGLHLTMFYQQSNNLVWEANTDVFLF